MMPHQRTPLLASVLLLAACGAPAPPPPSAPASPAVSVATPSTPVPRTGPLSERGDPRTPGRLSGGACGYRAFRPGRVPRAARTAHGAPEAGRGGRLRGEGEWTRTTRNRQEGNFAYLTGLTQEANAALLLLPGTVEREMLLLEDEERQARESLRGVPRRRSPSRAIEVRTGFDDGAARRSASPSYAARVRAPCAHRDALAPRGRLPRSKGPSRRNLALLQKVASRLPGAHVVERHERAPRDAHVEGAARDREESRARPPPTSRSRLTSRGGAWAKPGVREWDVKRTIEDSFRKGGARHFAYGSIVGSGPDGCVLRYPSDDRVIADGDLVLVDAGAEVNHYATDVTRTFPANGKFTTEQRAVYDVVLRAQKAALAAVHPGVTWHELELVARKVMGEAGYYDFYIHGLGHHVGLAVHDIGQATGYQPSPRTPSSRSSPGSTFRRSTSASASRTRSSSPRRATGTSARSCRRSQTIERWMAAARK